MIDKKGRTMYYRIKRYDGEYYQRASGAGVAYFTFPPWHAQPIDDKERARKISRSLREQGWAVHIVKVTWRQKAKEAGI